MTPRHPNWLTGGLYFWSSVPFVALASVYAEGFYTASALGHLPRLCMDGTPSTTLGNALSHLSCLAATATLFSLPAWLLLMGLNRARTNRSDWRVHAALYTFGWGLIVGLSALDPGGIIAWWID